ncbi:unnamed protein product [Cuscuta europaea]|uniref:Uncharacterized protein n=1 Tax=Cuscuta europaea TaxID=41803 RepID=A0A9P0YQM6_CUSEU|nr:unnamed protein product [Cuscuta europaea]
MSYEYMDTNTSSLESQISFLTSLIKESIFNSKAQDVKTCNICMSHWHLTDFCPKLQEEYLAQIDDVPHMRYDPFSNSNMSTEDMVRALTNSVTAMQQNMVQFQNETKSSIMNLETQMSQIAGVVSRLEAKDSEKPPSQLECDPKQQTFAITLTNEEEMQKEIQNPEEVEEEKDTELQLVKEEDNLSFKVKYLSLSSFEVPPSILIFLGKLINLERTMTFLKSSSKLRDRKTFH